MEIAKQFFRAAAAPAATLVVGALGLEFFLPGSVARWVSIPAVVFCSTVIALLGFFAQERHRDT